MDQKFDNPIPPKPEDPKESKKSETPGLEREGIATDYGNNIIFGILFCELLLGNRDFEDQRRIFKSLENVKEKLNKEISDYPTYTEYAGAEQVELLTPRGKEIVKRLDEIALEIKKFLNIELTTNKLIELKSLLVEANNLVDYQ